MANFAEDSGPIEVEVRSCSRATTAWWPIGTCDSRRFYPKNELLRRKAEVIRKTGAQDFHQ